MSLIRITKHLCYPGWWMRKSFPATEIAKIEAAIEKSETKTNGEIRFAVESSLPLKALWYKENIKARAIEVFSILRVWDTENNNGVLIYLLLADKKVEIKADRNINKCVGDEEWQRICNLMQTQFKNGLLGEGVVTGIEEIAEQLEKYFPYTEDDKNELSNKPVLL